MIDPLTPEQRAELRREYPRTELWLAVPHSRVTIAIGVSFLALTSGLAAAAYAEDRSLWVVLAVAALGLTCCAYCLAAGVWTIRNPDRALEISARGVEMQRKTFDQAGSKRVYGQAALAGAVTGPITLGPDFDLPHHLGYLIAVPVNALLFLPAGYLFIVVTRARLRRKPR